MHGSEDSQTRIHLSWNPDDHLSPTSRAFAEGQPTFGLEDGLRRHLSTVRRPLVFRKCAVGRRLLLASLYSATFTHRRLYRG